MCPAWAPVGTVGTVGRAGYTLRASGDRPEDGQGLNPLAGSSAVVTLGLERSQAQGGHRGLHERPGLALGHPVRVEGTEPVGTQGNVGLTHWGWWCGSPSPKLCLLGGWTPGQGTNRPCEDPKVKAPCHQGYVKARQPPFTEVQRVLGGNGPKARPRGCSPRASSRRA